MKTNHNKKSNVGLIFEFLSRQVLSGMIQNDNKKARQAVRLIKTYFCPEKELSEEFKLFNTLLYSQVKDHRVASRLLSSVLEEAKKLPYLQISKQKYDLLNDVRRVFGESVFDSQVENYRVYASVQQLMDDARGHKPIKDVAERVLFEEYVLEHLVDNSEVQRIEEYKEKGYYQERDDIDRLTYNLVMKKFNQKWKDQLSPAQVVMLREYIVRKDDDEFQNFANDKVEQIKKTLLDYKNTTSEAVITLKIDTVLNEIDSKKDDLSYLLVCAKLCEDMAGEQE